jgi:outer membrane protein OmpA-like peptidoglycan-associated protein
LLAAFLGLAGPLAALGTTMGPYGLGASVLGAGGAGVATADGPQGLYWNPAARADGGWNLGYDGGLGGPAQSVQQAATLSGPLDEGLDGGLIVNDQTFPQADSYHEDSLGLDLSIDLGKWISAGTTQKLVTADPGGLTGWSMDLGFLAAVPLKGDWRLDLGVAGTDMLSSLSWADGLIEEQPAVLRAGAALEAAPGTWLAFEQDQLENLGEDGVNQWRLGLQVSLFKRRVALRAGATQIMGDSLYATAGLGFSLPSVAQGLEADYAALLPTGSAGSGDTRQVLSLLWRFGAAAPLFPPAAPAPAASAAAGSGASLSRVLKDFAGHVQFARIDLETGPSDAEAWTLELKDRQGRTVRVLRGKGLLPPGVDWDGKDDAGRPVDGDGLSYVLRIDRPSGSTVQKRALLTPSADLGLGEGLAAGEGGDFALRQAAPLAVAVPKLSLKGAGLAPQAEFDLGDLAGAPQATGWELRVVDASGRTLRTLRGMGSPPKSVRWEGTDDLGQAVDASQGVRYEVRLTAPNGTQRLAVVAPLKAPVVVPVTVPVAPVAPVAAAALSVPAYASPNPRVWSGIPEATFRTDAKAGRLIYSFYFGRGLDDLTDSDQAMLVQAVAAIRGRGLNSAVMDGYASRDEALRGGAGALSQARADAVLKALMENGAVLKRATAKGWAAKRSDGAAKRGRAWDRKVELRLEAAP